MKASRILAVVLAAALALTGCGAGAARQSANPYTPVDDIVTYQPVAAGKTVITVGKYLAGNTDALETALE